MELYFLYFYIFSQEKLLHDDERQGSDHFADVCKSAVDLDAPTRVITILDTQNKSVDKNYFCKELI